MRALAIGEAVTKSLTVAVTIVFCLFEHANGPPKTWEHEEERSAALRAVFGRFPLSSSRRCVLWRWWTARAPWKRWASASFQARA
ncbi:hypothetical protein DEO23_15830 [Brachybacterium endophyticum]|uniref:Uncharacterized protein n=1 Tax=Brachybacterium endophyticum TaxID=2182385 RepID=A0A2U2RGG1_9MICO|nr:hypothetical protein DEO23_15830 [Brachybacterium endophyticum]